MSARARLCIAVTGYYPQMAEPTASLGLIQGRPAEQVFPTLNAGQIKRITAHGRPRRVSAGDTLLDVGEPSTRFFVVTAGRIRVVHPEQKTVVAEFGPGQFTGEIGVLSGRRSMLRVEA